MNLIIRCSNRYMNLIYIHVPIEVNPNLNKFVTFIFCILEYFTYMHIIIRLFMSYVG